MRTVLLTFLAFLFFINLSAQHTESNEHSNHEEQEHHKKYKVAFTLGATHIPAAFEEGHEEDEVFVPTIGLDFFYYINHKWNVSFVADLELSDYIVDFNREDLKREKALILALHAGYEVAPHWGVMVGGGIEIESHKNLAVLRIGTEYEIPLGNDWDISPAIFFDFKEDFNTYSLAIGIGKKF